MNDESPRPDAFSLFPAVAERVPLVVDSPHSCRTYPAGFDPVVPRAALLSSWDAWVDELFAAAPTVGAPFLVAEFPRFFLDVNRARDDIDPVLVDGELPFALNPTDKSAVGMGLIRRYALPGVEVHRAPLPAADLLTLIETFYDPYHGALTRLIDEIHGMFGRSVFLDCHSMKSRGNAMNADPGALRPDVVVSNREGQTASPELTEHLAGLFRDAGLHCTVNDPYKGAELIRRYSDPGDNRQAIQIELNRGLYMDEAKFTKLPGKFDALQSAITQVLSKFAISL